MFAITEGTAMQDEQPFRSGGADSVNGFCAKHDLSRTKLYDLWAKGQGPRFFYVGNQRRISDEAASEWRRSMELAAVREQNV
jgi:hypothetical protein